MADQELRLVGISYTLYTRAMQEAIMRLLLPDGECISIEMISDDEVGVLIYPSEEPDGTQPPPECVWSRKVESDG